MNTPTPTPRTDAYEYKAGWAAANYGEPWKPMDFARELERELTALTAERDQLRAEVERFKEWLADPHALHAHCLRTLTEGQIAHLFGERMTEIVNRVERAEAELATERARLDWLRDNVEEIYSKDQHGIVYLSGDNIRAAIDAGIKEGAK